MTWCRDLGLGGLGFRDVGFGMLNVVRTCNKDRGVDV